MNWEFPGPWASSISIALIVSLVCGPSGGVLLLSFEFCFSGECLFALIYVLSSITLVGGGVLRTRIVQGVEEKKFGDARNW